MSRTSCLPTDVVHSWELKAVADIFYFSMPLPEQSKLLKPQNTGTGALEMQLGDVGTFLSLFPQLQKPIT